MCDQLINRDTGQEINSRAQLRDLLGPAFDCINELDSDPDPMDCCLCNTDTATMLALAGYAWDPIDENESDVVTYKLPL